MLTPSESSAFYFIKLAIQLHPELMDTDEFKLVAEHLLADKQPAGYTALGDRMYIEAKMNYLRSLEREVVNDRVG